MLTIYTGIFPAGSLQEQARQSQTRFISKPPKPVPPPAGPFGTIYSNNSWNNTSDFITHGNSTAVMSGNYVNITSAASDDWNNTIDITPYQTKLERWRFKLRFKLVAWSGNSYGIGFGLKSANTHVQNDVMAFLQTSTTGIGGLYMLRSTRTIMAAGPVSLGIALNDVVDMEGNFYESVFHFTANNLTSGTSAEMSFVFATNGSTYVVPNTSHFAIMESGGTHQVQNIEISSDELTGADIATVGDSKTIGYFSNTFAGRYAAQLNKHYAPAIINAGGADAITNVLDRKDELLRLAANKYLLNIGSNDIRYGATLAETEKNYDSLVQILQSTGATVYHIVLPEDYTKALGVNMQLFKNWVAATYSSTYIDAWDSLANGSFLNGIYDTGDGVHLNQNANDKVYEAIIASGKLGTFSTLPVKLVSFEARKTDENTAVISWKAVSQFMVQFELLKSNDGIHFDHLFLPGFNPAATYQYTDNHLNKGVNYYKIQITESSGAIYYSKVINVKENMSGLRVYGLQKQGENEMDIHIDVPGSTIIDWSIIDAAGRHVKRGNEQLYKGDNKLKITTSSLGKGVYYLEIDMAGNTRPAIFPFVK